MLAELVLTEDVIAPLAITVLASLILGCIVWVARKVSKVVSHVLPHFDPELAEAAGHETLPQRMTVVEDSCTRQEARLGVHLDEEERKYDTVTAELVGLRDEVRKPWWRRWFRS